MSKAINIIKVLVLIYGITKHLSSFELVFNIKGLDCVTALIPLTLGILGMGRWAKADDADHFPQVGTQGRRGNDGI